MNQLFLNIQTRRRSSGRSGNHSNSSSKPEQSFIAYLRKGDAEREKGRNKEDIKVRIYEEVTDGNSRNLNVSNRLNRHFKDKPWRNQGSYMKVSETHASYRIPGVDAPIPLPEAARGVNLYVPVNRNRPLVRKPPPDIHDPLREEDVYAKVNEMKRRVLRGENVPMDEIHKIRKKAGLAKPFKKISIENELKKGEDSIYRRRALFCKNGIIHVPTPHKPMTEFNSFGSPADLRISLSNVDTPEYQGRRRFFLDFTGFFDKDIKLYLENASTLVIRGSRPTRDTKEALTIKESIDLPSDLPVDNLRAVRDVFGNLVIEEAWKFS